MAHNPAISRDQYARLFEYRWFFFSDRQRQMRLEGEASRWNFIDRFFDDGIILHHIGAENFAGQMADIIRVDDRRYGHLFEAFFARRSGLLLGVREGLSPAEAEDYRQNYQKSPPIWTTTYSKYRRVQGVLTPHRLVRTGPPCPHCLGRSEQEIRSIIQLHIAYNGQAPEPEPPTLEDWPP